MASMLKSTRQLVRKAATGASRAFSSQVTTLSNGLRVATEKTEGSTSTATVGVWIDTGSRYETAENNGVAHFTEHMFFKGTPTRSVSDLNVEIENMGGHLNAYTSREQTVFYFKVFDKDVPQAVDILGDMLQNSKFDAQAIERERDVILREMQEVETQMDEVVFDKLHQTAYRDTALGRTILGSVDNIRTISQKQIQDYVATHYVAPRMVVAASGNVEHADIVKLAEKTFGNVPTKAPNGIDAFMEPAVFTGSDIRHREDNMEQLHVAYGFPTAGWCDSDNYPLMIIQSMLGNWDASVGGGAHSSSRLVANLAEEDLATSVSAFNTQYSDSGLFGIYATCHAETAAETMWHVTTEVTRLCYEVDPILLEEAKNRLRVTLLSQLDGSTTVCEDLGRSILTYGRRMPKEEVLARIDAVDVDAVKACANRYFYDRDFALASVGPSFELPDYNYLRRRTYYLRF